MKRKILMGAMLLAMISFAAPVDNYAAGDQQGRNKSAERSRGGQDVRWGDDNNRGRRRRTGRRNQNTYGYRNYGQYRRTQVGNRRYRTVRRSFWRDGIRRTRLVRVY